MRSSLHLLMLACASALVACTGHQASSAPHPAPTKTAFLGIERMARGHLSSIDRNVVVLWVDPEAGTQSEETAIRVFKGIEPMLHASDLQIVVIKVTKTEGIFTSSESYVFSKAYNGVWQRLDDKEMLQKIIQAGI